MTEKRFTLVDDYLIEYDGSYFDLHKPSDIRSLVTVIGYVTDENEQLKKQLNYIQNSISEHIKHQKTELGQKALKEIIEDYNEWLLGHKELKE